MPETLKIVGIGAGNLASHILPACKNIGCTIVQVFSRSIHNANKLAHLTSSEAINDLNEIQQDADLYLIMVKDDALEETIDRLPYFSKGQILAHTAGAKSMKVLAQKSERTGVFYPLDSFRKNQYTDLSKSPFLVNSNDASTLRTLRSLARKISPSVWECDDNTRLKYHLSAVFINNFTNHLSCLTQKYLDENELDPNVLNTIIESGYNKIRSGISCDSQTGPAIRNDFELINKHLELIKSHPHLSVIYKVMTDSIIDMYKTKDHENSK